jgi:hypothetical protein
MLLRRRRWRLAAGAIRQSRPAIATFRESPSLSRGIELRPRRDRQVCVITIFLS